ncbi:hypothetical protein XaplCFBP3123_17405 [Xanthomonas arboricola pv. populi]|nr:hypothetical protein XaplCFBP3123_17405 [Xanthomonas arboricola pv. populi]
MLGTASLEIVMQEASMPPVEIAGLGRQLQRNHLSVVGTQVMQVQVRLQTGHDRPAAVQALRSQCRRAQRVANDGCRQAR